MALCWRCFGRCFYVVSFAFDFGVLFGLITLLPSSRVLRMPGALGVILPRLRGGVLLESSSDAPRSAYARA